MGPVDCFHQRSIAASERAVATVNSFDIVGSRTRESELESGMAVRVEGHGA